MAYLGSMQKILLLLTLSIACQFTYAQDKIILQGDTLISLEGRQILLNQQGFPQQITFLTDTGKANLLAENIHFHFTRVSDGKDIKLKNGALTFIKKTDSKLEWQVTDSSDELEVKVNGLVASQTAVLYFVMVKALQDVDLKEITMHIPLRPDLPKNMEGLGLEMGTRPDSLFHWKWPGSNLRSAEVWLGTANLGLGYSLNGSAWDNGTKGGITIGIKGRSLLANNYNGPRTLHKGDELPYIFLLGLKRNELIKK